MPPCRNRILRWMMLPVLLFPPAALAEVRPLLGIGFNQGDDELTIPHLTVLGQGESIYANGGACVQAGALFYRDSPRQYGVRATVGYQYDNSDASNSSATYYAVPIEMIPFRETARALRRRPHLSRGAAIQGDRRHSPSRSAIRRCPRNRHAGGMAPA